MWKRLTGAKKHNVAIWKEVLLVSTKWGITTNCNFSSAFSSTFDLAQHRNTAYKYFVYVNKENFRSLWLLGNHMLTQILKTMQEALNISQRKDLSKSLGNHVVGIIEEGSICLREERRLFVLYEFVIIAGLQASTSYQSDPKRFFTSFWCSACLLGFYSQCLWSIRHILHASPTTNGEVFGHS